MWSDHPDLFLKDDWNDNEFVSSLQMGIGFGLRDWFIASPENSPRCQELEPKALRKCMICNRL